MNKTPCYCALFLACIVVSGLVSPYVPSSWTATQGTAQRQLVGGGPGSSPALAMQATRTPTLATCRPTPTPIPVSVVPNSYAIYVRPHVVDTAQLAAALAQEYGLTDIYGALPDAGYFIATVPSDRVTELGSDPRLSGVDEVVIVPAPFDYIGPLCFTPTPTSTPVNPRAQTNDANSP